MPTRRVVRTIRWVAARATRPATTLGTRHPNPLSPNTSIESAISSLPSGGCSVFGSRPAMLPA